MSGGSGLGPYFDVQGFVVQSFDNPIARTDDVGAIGVLPTGQLRRFHNIRVGTGGIESAGPITVNGAPVGGGVGSVTQKVFADSPFVPALNNACYDVDCTGGSFAANIPTPVGNNGLLFGFTKIDATQNKITITPAAGTIRGLATLVLAQQWASVLVLADGANYGLLASYLPSPFKALVFADSPFTVVLGNLVGSTPRYGVSAAAGAFAFNLPDPATVPGQAISVGKTDTSANAVTLSSAAGVIGVGGASTYIMNVPGTWLGLVSDGTNWQIGAA